MQTPAEACPSCGIVFSKFDGSAPQRPRTMATPMPMSVPTARCQACGAAGKVADVTFRQNIGMILARQSKSISGMLCRECVSKYFWQMTLTTLAVGWLGMISIIIAPVFIVLNIVSFARSRSALA